MILHWWEKAKAVPKLWYFYGDNFWEQNTSFEICMSEANSYYCNNFGTSINTSFLLSGKNIALHFHSYFLAHPTSWHQCELCLGLMMSAMVKSWHRWNFTICSHRTPTALIITSCYILVCARGHYYTDMCAMFLLFAGRAWYKIWQSSVAVSLSRHESWLAGWMGLRRGFIRSRREKQGRAVRLERNFHLGAR